MSNRAYLINAALLSGDPAELKASLASDGPEYVEVAEAANRIPVPWLCCFREADLQPVSVELTDFEGNKTPFRFSAPRTEVSTAISNLEAALPIFEALAGSAEVGRAYWQAALDGLRELPLPYLTLDPIDVLLMNDPDDEADAFSKCLSGKLDSIPDLKRMSFFEDGSEPYSLSDYLSKSPEELEDQARSGNSAALDAMFTAPEYRLWHKRS